jgi:thymidylate synthase
MLHKVWLSTLTTLLESGSAVAPNNPAGPTRELINRPFFLGDSSQCLLDVPARKLNVRFAVAEAIWMATGRSDLESLQRYNSVMKQFSDDGAFLTGAYGPHLRGGLARVIRKLKEDPNTRQAVLQIPRPQVYYTKDEPCTLSMQFIHRDGFLNCIVTMRSSDIWLGIPYDVFSFAFFQNCLAGQLGMLRGWLSINAGSQHLYERDVDKVVELLHLAGVAGTLQMPSFDGFPPAWLEDVLATQDESRIPANQVDISNPWFRLAMVLLSPTSIQARESLRVTARSDDGA